MSLKTILKHIPKGKKPPKSLSKFVAAARKVELWVRWERLQHMNKTAREITVPFVHLEDGGILALWYYSDEPAVVQIGSEGESEVIATTFADFCAGINAGKSGVDDFAIFEEGELQIPGVKPKPRHANPPLQKKFDKWFDEQSGGPLPDTGDASQALLKRLIAITIQMAKDKINGSDFDPDYVDIELEVTRTANGLELRYLKWRGQSPVYPRVPTKYNLTPEIEAAIAMCKHPKKKEYRISLHSECIFVDRGSELTLMTPEKIKKMLERRAKERRRRRKR
jgi:hypothetical protein